MYSRARSNGCRAGLRLRGCLATSEPGAEDVRESAFIFYTIRLLARGTVRVSKFPRTILNSNCQDNVEIRYVLHISVRKFFRNFP